MSAMFKSTDFLRRERVYTPKKKKLLIGRSSAKPNLTTPSAHKRIVEFNKEISVADLAHQMSEKGKLVAKKLLALGLSYPDEADGLEEWILDLEAAQLVAGEFEFEVKDITPNAEEMIQSSRSKATPSKKAEVDDGRSARGPVITIMGHVDHGKTSLLDLIRRARVVSKEAGGITQHIGAYRIDASVAVENLRAFQESQDAEAAKGAAKKGKKVKERAEAPAKGAKTPKAGAASGYLTFLDTPGHAAFSAIRSRGAQCTDIVILVVAASEGVMPQTREAIDHAKAAGVPIIVAMNKMDLPDANPDKIRQQLSEVGLISEEWGGDTIFVPVSAHTGLGVDKLLEMIQLQAELLELKARPDGFADGIIIEAKLDKGRGSLATVLVRNGRLRVGDYVAAGEVFGRVRALLDDNGKNTPEAGPSTPVEIMGLSGVPEAGDTLNSVPDERSAKALADLRVEERRKEDSRPRVNSVEDVYALMAKGDLKELPIILKSDVKGSAEAIEGALAKLPQTKVRLKMLSASVGGISENDILLAAASKAIVIGFNVRPDSKAQSLADSKGVPVKTYSIIYNLIDDVSNAMVGLLEPTIKEQVTGQAEVRNVFNVSRVGTVAGCMVTSGKITRSDMVRVIREGRVIYTNKLSGLKRFKDDAREVAQGFECGISVESFNDVKPGDILETFVQEKILPSLEDGGKASSASL
jgi:translation initiation factor IF-2